MELSGTTGKRLVRTMLSPSSMKLLIVCGVVVARSALACPPLPSCADDYCHDASAVIEATIVAVAEEEVTVEVTQAFGDAELGTATFAAIPGVVFDNEIGKPRVLGLRSVDGALVIEEQIAIDAQCFGEATLAEVADTVLAASCDAELGGIRRDGPPCEPGCDAGGGGLGLLGIGFLLGAQRLVANRRSVRRP